MDFKDPTLPPPNVEEVYLEEFTAEIAAVLKKSKLKLPTAQVSVRDLGSKVGYGLVGFMAQEQMGVVHKEILWIKTPKDWWQHLKLRFAPRWAKKRWPVQWEEATMEASFSAAVLYPDLPWRPGDLGRRFAVVVPDSDGEKDQG